MLRKLMSRALLTTGVIVWVVVPLAMLYGFVMVRHGFSARDEPFALEAALAGRLRNSAIPRRYRSMKNPHAASSEMLARARAHWADHCASCHANDGSGNTAIGMNLYPRAPDMRTPHTQGLSDGELFYIIRNGIRLTGMPAWGGADDDGHETWELVAFIRHLPRLTNEEKREMEKLNPKSPHEEQEREAEEQFLNP